MADPRISALDQQSLLDEVGSVEEGGKPTEAPELAVYSIVRPELIV